VVLVCVVFLTVKPALLSILMAEAFGLPTTEGTRGSGAATTRGTLELGSNSVPSATPCLRTMSFFLLDGRRSMWPTSRPAACNLRFALAKPSPLTAGTLASFGIGVDGADVGCADGLLAGAGSAVLGWVSSRSRGHQPDDEKQSEDTASDRERNRARAQAGATAGAFRRWCVHACPSQSRSRPD